MTDNPPAKDKPKETIIACLPDGGVTWNGEPSTYSEVMTKLKGIPGRSGGDNA